MCVINHAQADFNMNYLRDMNRGRGWERFDKIKRYAQRRWKQTQNLRHSRRWIGILESIEKRKPR
jgi:hypothetical protein